MRLGVALALGTVGSVGMWSAVVALPAVQADFGIARGDASLPFTLTMIGFGAGGIVMGRLADRFGVVRPLLIGVIALVAGYLLSAFATNIWQFALAQGLLGFGASGSFGPIMTDISHWFEKRRGIAVALASCGNYLAGTIWPPLIQYFISTQGWRATQVGIGIDLRRRHAAADLSDAASGASACDADRRDGVERHARHARPVVQHADGTVDRRRRRLLRRHVDAAGPYRRLLRRPRLRAGARRRDALGDAGLRLDQPRRLRLHRRPHRRRGDVAASAPCCKASRCSFICCSTVYVSLYVISALFGLFQGGIVPMYAIIVREYFAPSEAGTRLGIVLMATLFGMALGGWMSGVIFDLTGSYMAAFLNGLGWNLHQRHHRGMAADAARWPAHRCRGVTANVRVGYQTRNGPDRQHTISPALVRRAMRLIEQRVPCRHRV